MKRDPEHWERGADGVWWPKRKRKQRMQKKGPVRKHWSLTIEIGEENDGSQNLRVLDGQKTLLERSYSSYLLAMSVGRQFIDDELSRRASHIG